VVTIKFREQVEGGPPTVYLKVSTSDTVTCNFRSWRRTGNPWKVRGSFDPTAPRFDPWSRGLRVCFRATLLHVATVLAPHVDLKIIPNPCKR
jgi:hypothetical protein